MSKIIRSSNVITINNLENTHRKADSIIDKSRQEAENIIDEALDEKNRIIKEAREKAETILEITNREAEKEAADIKEQAEIKAYNEGLEKGYSEGYNKGLSEGEQKAYNETIEEKKSILEEANRIKAEYLNTREEVLNSLESKVIDLVKNSVEKIVNNEIQDGDYMVNTILKGLNSLNNKDNLVIRVSKYDYQNVMDNKEEILSKGSIIEDIDIKLDSNLERGDTVIESAQGNVNSSINLQIQEMKKVLDDILFEE